MTTLNMGLWELHEATVESIQYPTSTHAQSMTNEETVATSYQRNVGLHAFCTLLSVQIFANLSINCYSFPINGSVSEIQTLLC